MHSYLVKKGRVKEFYDDALFKDVLGLLYIYVTVQNAHSLHLFLVVGRRTAFEVDWLFEQTLHIFHGNSSFHSIVSAFNDFHNDRYQTVFFLFVLNDHPNHLLDGIHL